MSRHTYTKELLEPIVKTCKSMAQVCRMLQIAPATGSQTHIKKRIQSFNIDTSHFTGCGWNRGNHKPSKRRLEDILKEGYRYHPKSAATRWAMITVGTIYRCIKCDNNGSWNGEPLTLEIDHINNDWTDNRKENVQFICPNCHAQKTKSDKSVSKYCVTRSRQIGGLGES